ncbi:MULTISPECIES: hypothetical protein [unclassified Nocardioides]|uniref:hypothetical protein n=1 Tax=unclassified Nocardioides TaxID=2615069 RepID=UPI000B2E16C2|nr:MULTISPECIES: hypothetical protein [unclassified Nocardioides]
MPVPARPSPTTSPRRLPLVVGALTLLLLAFGLTGATATSGTTGVAITPLTPVKVISTAAAVSAGKTFTFVASGGTTTVPTNALVVELAVTVKGTKAGTVSFAPLGEPGNGSPTTVSWAAGGSGAGTVRVNLGNSNKVVATNSSLAAATLGVKITGYSTLVTAAGISGTGGGDGQVLTNQGNGTVAWESLPAPAPVPVVLKAHVTDAGTLSFGAVSSSLDGPGFYRVNFGRPLASCAVTGTPGGYNGGSWNGNAIVAVFTSSGSPVATVVVRRGDNGTAINTGFFLTVIC